MPRSHSDKIGLSIWVISISLGLIALWVAQMSTVSAPMAGTLVFLMSMGCGVGAVVGAYAVEHWRTYRWQGPVVAIGAFAVVLSASLSDLNSDDLRTSSDLLLKWFLAGAIPAGSAAFLTGYLASKLNGYQNVAEAVGLSEPPRQDNRESHDSAST